MLIPPSTRPRRSPTAQLLVGSLVPGQQPDICDIAGSGPELHHAAAWHRISPAVYLHLRDHVDDPGLLGPLEAGYRRQVARHLRTLVDLKIAGAALDDAGIRWALIKGPALAALWPRPDMREYHDLDLLVDRRRFTDALCALTGSGATLIDRNWTMIRNQLRAELTVQLRHGTALDLHWDLVNDADLRRQFCFATDALLDRRDTATISGTVTPVLDRTDAALHVGYHTTLSGAHRLLWLMDMAAVCAEQVDQAALRRRAKAYGVELPLALAQERSRRAFGDYAIPAASHRFRAWRLAARAADRLRPIPWVPGSRGSSRVLYQNVRRTARGSLLPSIRDALRRTGPPDPAWRNPLHEDVPDAAARREYLDLVEGPHKP
jgi:hypothetical protein